MSHSAATTSGCSETTAIAWPPMLTLCHGNPARDAADRVGDGQADEPPEQRHMVVRRAREQPADDRHGRARQPQQTGNWPHQVAIFVHAPVIGANLGALS